MEHTYLEAYLRFEKIGKGIIWIRMKTKTIPINFNKVSFKLEFSIIDVIEKCFSVSCNSSGCCNVR